MQTQHNLKMRWSAEITNVLSSIQTKLVSLTLYGLDMENLLEHLIILEDQDGFFSVLSACSALEEVQLDVREMILDELMHELFQNLNSVTKMTCMIRQSDYIPCKDIIDAIAYNLTNLESLTVLTDEPLKGEDVNVLVALSHLKYVVLWHRFINQSVSGLLEKYTVEIVERLKDCAQLMQLNINEIYIKNRSPLIAEAAATYNRKDFDMFIGGVQYRTW